MPESVFFVCSFAFTSFFFFHVSLFLSNSSSSSMNRSSSGEYEEKKKWKKEMEKYFSYNVFCSTLLHTHISLCSGLSQKAPRVYEKPKQTRVEVRSRERRRSSMVECWTLHISFLFTSSHSSASFRLLFSSCLPAIPFHSLSDMPVCTDRDSWLRDMCCAVVARSLAYMFI